MPTIENTLRRRRGARGEDEVEYGAAPSYATTPKPTLPKPPQEEDNEFKELADKKAKERVEELPEDARGRAWHLYNQQKNQLGWAQALETVGHAVARFAAAERGITDIKFDKSDWGKRYDRLLREHGIKLEEIEKGEKEEARKEERGQDIKRRADERDQDFKRQKELIGVKTKSQKELIESRGEQTRLTNKEGFENKTTLEGVRMGHADKQQLVEITYKKWADRFKAANRLKLQGRDQEFREKILELEQDFKEDLTKLAQEHRVEFSKLDHQQALQVVDVKHGYALDMQKADQEFKGIENELDRNLRTDLWKDKKEFEKWKVDTLQDFDKWKTKYIQEARNRENEAARKAKADNLEKTLQTRLEIADKSLLGKKKSAAKKQQDADLKALGKSLEDFKKQKRAVQQALNAVKAGSMTGGNLKDSEVKAVADKLAAQGMQDESFNKAVEDADRWFSRGADDAVLKEDLDNKLLQLNKQIKQAEEGIHSGATPGRGGQSTAMKVDPEDREAYAWAKANMDDPKAKKFIEHLQRKYSK